MRPKHGRSRAEQRVEPKYWLFQDVAWGKQIGLSKMSVPAYTVERIDIGLVDLELRGLATKGERIAKQKLGK